MSDTKASAKVITPIAMLSYPHLDKAQPGKKATDKQKFSATFVFAPGTDLTAMRAAALAAAESRWGAKAAEMIRLKQIKSGFRDDAEGKGYVDGSIFVGARTEQQPGIVYSHAGPDGKPARVPQEKIKDELYPGCQVRASLTAFPYDTDGNKGVSFALNNLQKVAEGTRLDGRKDAEDEFTADLNAVPSDLASMGV